MRGQAEGFTLIELMVVMLLITIVLSVTVPRLSSGLMQDPQKKANRWMINTVQALRAAAIEKQKSQALVVDFANNRLFTIDSSMDDEALAAAAEKAFVLPKSIQLVDVLFPNDEQQSVDTVEIYFYAAGYCDPSIIHLKNDDGYRFSYKIEPLLPKVKVSEEWLTY